MGFLDQIFGTSLPVAVRFLIAFGIVLGLIALTAWAVRRLAGRRLPVANQGRARQPRLGVLDAFAIDARRRLVLIRRDNVEHLIMIGGPNDLVVESNIVRAPSQGLPVPQQRTGRAPDVDTGRPVVPQADPEFSQGNAPQIPPANQQRTASPPPRPVAAPPVVRTPMPAPVATAPEPPQAAPTAAAPAAPEPPSSRMPGFFRSTMNRQAGPAPVTPPPASRPQEPVAPAPQQAAAKPDVDPLFADIEKRLEQALQRPAPANTPAAPAPAPTPAASPPAPPSAASRPAPLPPRRPLPERPPVAPRQMAEREAPRPTPAGPDAERTQPQSATKATLDALEEEMASLLGRDRQP